MTASLPLGIGSGALPEPFGAGALEGSEVLFGGVDVPDGTLDVVLVGAGWVGVALGSPAPPAPMSPLPAGIVDVGVEVLGCETLGAAPEPGS